MTPLDSEKVTTNLTLFSLFLEKFNEQRKIDGKATEVLSKLPDQKLIEVSEFAEFLIVKAQLKEGILLIVSDSKSIRFLEDEKDLYSVSDIKEAYK